MHSAGIQGVTRRKFCRTTRRDEPARPAPDLMERDFTAPGPGQRWVADITYVPTWAGFLFLAVVLDVFTRRVVGWSMSSNQNTELVTEPSRWPSPASVRIVSWSTTRIRDANTRAMTSPRLVGPPG